MTEIEIKIKIDDPKALREKILGLGAVVARDRHLECDSLFDFDPPVLRPGRRALRLRAAGKRATLTYKGEPRKSRSFSAGLKAPNRYAPSRCWSVTVNRPKKECFSLSRKSSRPAHCAVMSCWVPSFR